MTKRTAIFIGPAAVAVIAAAVVLINVFKKDGGNDFEYVSVSDAIKNADSVLGNTYENFVLPETLDIDVSGELYTITADNKTKTCDQKEICDQLADIMGMGKEESYEVQEFDALKVRYEHGGVWCSTERSISAARTELTIPEHQLEAGKQYVIGRDSLDDKYILNGEEYSVKEAVEYAEEFANSKLMPFFINNTKVKAVAACAFKVDEQNYWIFVQLQHYMFGCPVSTTGSVSIDRPFMRPQQLMLTFDGKDQICHVSNECYVAVLEKKKVDKIISLPSALKHLEKELAPGSRYTVTSLSLEYCTRTEYSNVDFEYRPMWCLTIAKGRADNINIYPQKVIYIDALNGDVRCYDDIENTMVFESTTPS